MPIIQKGQKWIQLRSLLARNEVKFPFILSYDLLYWRMTLCTAVSVTNENELWVRRNMKLANVSQSTLQTAIRNTCTEDIRSPLVNSLSRPLMSFGRLQQFLPLAALRRSRQLEVLGTRQFVQGIRSRHSGFLRRPPFPPTCEKNGKANKTSIKASTNHNIGSILQSNLILKSKPRNWANPNQNLRVKSFFGKKRKSFYSFFGI